MCPFQSSRPLRGATSATAIVTPAAVISILAPLAGRDSLPQHPAALDGISILAPLAGRDAAAHSLTSMLSSFQSSRPVRGATGEHSVGTGRDGISILAPLAGRDPLYFNRVDFNFNPRAPCGARRLWCWDGKTATNFNPRAPCGARQQKYTKIACVFAITDKGQMLFPRQAPPVRTLFEGAGENRDETRCEPSRKYRMLALRTTGSSAPLEDMFVCSQSVRSYSHTFSRDNKTEGYPFLHP